MGDFPPGEIGSRFNRIDTLDAGEFVYVRMQVMQGEPSDRDSFACKLVMPAVDSVGMAFQCLWVHRSQIVCREPKAMVAEGGVVRASEIAG